MTLAYASLLTGVLLLAMLLISTFLPRLPFNGAMMYLGIGVLLGPAGLDLVRVDPLRHAATLALLTELALLISLFAIGLKLGVPLLDRRWVLPLRLAFLTMAGTVALVAVAGVYLLGLPLGAAVLLGAILAPTDPVLASDIQPATGNAPDPTRFNLAAEGALNDATAYPFLLLGLALLGQHELGTYGWRWWLLDLGWTTAGGMAIGAATGALVGNLVIYLRTRHQRAVGMDEFLVLGVIALAYGAAQLCQASGFLAVFAAGLALNRVQDYPIAGSLPLAGNHLAQPSSATHSHHATAVMRRAVRRFNSQLERLIELALVVLIGIMLPSVPYAPELWWFIPLLLLVIRPLAVVAGLAGHPVPRVELFLTSWFGIRGIGSVYYLTLALQHDTGAGFGPRCAALVLSAVAASIVVHGLSAALLMRLPRAEATGR